MTRAVEIGARTAPGGVGERVKSTKISAKPMETTKISVLEKDNKWFRTYPEFMQADIIKNSALYSQEIQKIPSFNSTVLLDFLSHIDVKGYTVSHQVSEILGSLSVTHPEVIRALYDALVSMKDVGKAAMMMRLVIQSNDLFNLIFCKTTVAAEIKGTIDLWGISPEGEISWFAVWPGSVEENAAGAFVNELMSINPFYFANVKRIILVANRFLWTVKQIVARFGKIQTRTGTATVELLEEIIPGQFTFAT